MYFRMRLRTLKGGIQLKGKRVLVRVEANVPIKGGKAVDGPRGRIARAAVTIDWLRQRGAKIIIITHLGRPGGRRIFALSTYPVAKRFSELLKVNVRYSKNITGASVQKLVERLKDGELLLLENLRFDARERANDPGFARELASLADLYVNDAFGNSHRAHVSMNAITKELPSYAGPIVANEIRELSKLHKNPKHPFVLAMGGVKLETKIPVMMRFLNEVDYIITGGALATTFLVAQGINVGRSLFDKDEVSLSKKIFDKAKGKILIPTDVVVATSFRKDAKMKIVPVNEIAKSDRIVDVGPATMEQYLSHINKAKTIVWNGPFGYCEIDKFCNGTNQLAHAIANRTGKAVTIVGGGDTLPAVDKADKSDQFTLMSTGGGAMLTFLAEGEMPGIEPLVLKE